GLLDEVRRFYQSHDAKTAAQAIGCKELRPYLCGDASLTACVETLKRATRRYAKRQLTWFRRDERIHWLFCDQYDCADALLGAALEVVSAASQADR
ncbi:MAG: tRNA dimethylallyltransferase, partial [Oscillospiraceae bacterium]